MGTAERQAGGMLTFEGSRGKRWNYRIPQKRKRKYSAL